MSPAACRIARGAYRSGPSGRRGARPQRGRRDGVDPIGQLQPAIAWVAAEEFVGAVAANGCGHQAAGELRQQVQRDERRVGQRLIKSTERVWRARGRVLGREDELVMFASRTGY
jgi:hypothetical protein